jgi:hypothetical protein
LATAEQLTKRERFAPDPGKPNMVTPLKTFRKGLHFQRIHSAEFWIQRAVDSQDFIVRTDLKFLAFPECEALGKVS